MSFVVKALQDKKVIFSIPFHFFSSHSGNTRESTVKNPSPIIASQNPFYVAKLAQALVYENNSVLLN